MIAERTAWRAEFAAIDPPRPAFVDESGASTAMDCTHGRCASGKWVDGPVPQGHSKVTTLTAGVRLWGVPEAACLAFDGATDATAFEAYAQQCLAPTLRPGDIVVMDTWGPSSVRHRSKRPVPRDGSCRRTARTSAPSRNCSPN